MTCYYCARTSGHEAECPTGGVYANATGPKMDYVGAWMSLKGKCEFLENALDAKAKRVDALEAELKALRAEMPKISYYATLQRLKEEAFEQAAIASTPWIIPYDKKSEPPSLPATEDRKSLHFDATGPTETETTLEEFDGAEWKPVDLSNVSCKCQACVEFYSR